MRRIVFAAIGLFLLSCSDKEVVNTAVRESIKAQAILWNNYLEYVQNNPVITESGDTVKRQPNFTEFQAMSYRTALGDTIEFYKP